VVCEINTDASDADVVDAYRGAAVAVCPSRFEGFGLAPIEAVAMGLPVVASDIPPHREFTAGAARFFPLDDEQELSAAVAAALDHPASNPEAVQSLSIPAAADRFFDRLTQLVQ
jgi:glycosyltransferase involved in cell wall biosynthesis